MIANPVQSEDPATRRSARLLGQPELFVALALGVLYIVVMSGHSYSIDGVLMYRQSVAIAQHLSLHFADSIYWGSLFDTSKYGIGLSIAYLPGVWLLSLFGASMPVPPPHTYDWDLFYRDFVYAAGASPVHAVVTAYTAYLVGRLGRLLGLGAGLAVLAMAAFGLASPALVYARGDFAQPLLALCLIVGVFAGIRYASAGTMRWVALAALVQAFAVLTRPVEGSFLLPALLLVVTRGRSFRRWDRSFLVAGAALGTGYVVGVALTMGVNWGRYGSPFQTGYSEISWGTPIWVGVPGVLVSPARGILWQFPLLLLVPAGLHLLWKQGEGLAASAVTLLALLLFLNTALWVPWWGAWSWGSRLFVPAWPVLAVLAAAGVGALGPRWRGWLPHALFAGGVLWAIPPTLVDLLGGYASAYDGSVQSFELSGYPPFGAWRFLHHIRANNLADASAIDNLWLRIARDTHNLSLAIPLVLLAIGVVLALEARKRLVAGQALQERVA